MQIIRKENTVMEKELILQKAELVASKLRNLGGADYDQDKATSREESAKGFIQRDFGIEEWDWPQGVGLYGMYKLQSYYGDSRYMDFLKNWYDQNVAIGLPSKNVNTTAPYLALSCLYDQFDQSEKYKDMCIERAKWLMDELPKTKDGGFQHVTSAIGDRNGITLHDGEMWVDTLVMTVLFLNQLGQKLNQPQWQAEAVHQFLVHIKYLYDKRDRLFHHGWSFNRNDNFGGVYWCRGNSWFTFGVLDYLEACGDNLDAGTRQFLIDTFKAQIERLAGLQADSGLWHTVLDDAASYEEVSGSAAITAGLIKGIKTGILGPEYLDCAQKAVAGICASITDDGTVQGVSAGTGIGMDAAHYKQVAIHPMAYGQSLTLIALCEALRL